MSEKYKHCPRCGQPLEDDGSCPGCPYGHKRNPLSTKKEAQRTCPWNDHGFTCGLVGSLTDSTDGSGPWYCAKHFWRLKGWPEKRESEAPMSYRERRCAELGIDDKGPKLEDAGPLKCVANDAPKLANRLRSHELGPAELREPGQDDEERSEAA